LEPVDFKVILRNILLNNFDDLIDVIEPFFTVLDVVKGIKGKNLNVLEAAQQNLLPFGAAQKAKFIAESVLDMKRPASSKFQLIDYSLLNGVLPILRTLYDTVLKLPLPYLPYIVMASIGQEKLVRQLHPVLSGDDLPPWERLSKYNILFILLLDQFASTAADQTGFFRTFE